MNEKQAQAYVHATAEALGLALDAGRSQRVAAHLQRTAAMARLLEEVALVPEDELAEIYCPKRPVPGQDTTP